jgi:hypothetical protein
MVALDNKHNLAQREQYYAAVQKGITTHAVERIPGENFEVFTVVSSEYLLFCGVMLHHWVHGSKQSRGAGGTIHPAMQHYIL